MDDSIYKKIIIENDYVIKTDLDGNIIFANEKFCKLSGYKKEELLCFNYNNIVKEDKLEKNISKSILNSLSLGNSWNGVIENRKKKNGFFFIDAHVNIVKNEEKNNYEILCFGKDVTKHIKLHLYDELTNLKNRESLKSEIKEENYYALVIANLDNFSEVNDFYGGIIGDKLIKKCANRLSNIFSYETIYRLQSDEFAILISLPNEYNKFFYENVLKNKLKSLFDEPMIIDDIELNMTATYGLHIGNQNLLRNANIAYKNSKKLNENFCIYKDNMFYKFANYSNNKKIAAEVKEAIKDNKVIPYYQPIVDNKSGEVFKYEALARLINHDVILMPGSFIDVSKTIKYYNEITRAMIKKTFDNFKKTNNREVSINLTIEDIANSRTFDFIIEQLKKHNNNNIITFELVESSGIEDFDMFNNFVQIVKKYGVKISIDDFGTGYSNFSYLSKLEPDFLKIDGSLIKNIKNKKDFDVVKTIVEFAKMYNIKTIAEFVENEEIFILVKELGIDYSQGYYFSKPVSFEEIDFN